MGEQVKREQVIWITWEHQRRSVTLSDKLGVPLYEFTSSRPRFIKHPLFVLKTLWLLFLKRPITLIVQNPSAFLTILVIILKPLFRYFLIVDAHNAGIYPFEPAHQKYANIFPFMHRYTDLTILTNEILADIVYKGGGRAIILPDLLPGFDNIHKCHRNDGTFVVTFICSYAADEPYLEVFKAAALLPADIKIYITGNNQKLTNAELALAGPGVEFTGFLDEEEYVSQLCNSDCIMVLTTFPDCLVCGAYEAVALEVPLILSDTPVLRAWFTRGVTYSGNKGEELANAIVKTREKHEYFLKEISELKKEIKVKWQLAFSKLLVKMCHCKVNQ